MKTKEKRTSRSSPKKRFCVTFLLSTTVVVIVVGYIFHLSELQKKERSEYLAHTIGSETYEMMLSQLSKTQVLEAYLVQTGGTFEGAENVAEILLRDEAVRNVLFAPNGIVEAVFPLESNEKVIGLNMYEDGLGNWEARAAIEAKELYMAGPFELLQGGRGVAGRLPVYLKDESGESYFWGIVSVTLDFPEIVENSSIQYLNEQGYACEIWRITPDTQKRETILETKTQIASYGNAYNYEMTIFNAEWNISVASSTPWYKEMNFWITLGLGILVSLLIALNSYNKEMLWVMEQREAQRKIEDLKREVEFEQSTMLLSQIRSHFFYHTLNSVQALIVLEPDEAYKMVDDFSRYMRFNMDSITVENGLCTFKEELRSVRSYTDINQKQLGNRLKMVYEVGDIDFKIPVLTIQPIVENAILHGIKPKVGGGTIVIRLEELDDCMQVTVEDDGVGFVVNDEVMDQSVGMKNVRKRIKQFEGCEIRIESKLQVGTKVILIYPKDL